MKSLYKDVGSGIIFNSKTMRTAHKLTNREMIKQTMADLCNKILYSLKKKKYVFQTSLKMFI